MCLVAVAFGESCPWPCREVRGRGVGIPRSFTDGPGKGTPSLGRKGGSLAGSPVVRRKVPTMAAETDVLFFGVGGEKNSHVVLRFDFLAKAVTLREAEKGSQQTVPFGSLVRVRTEDSELLMQLECKNESISWWCYNEFDYDSIQRLCRKIIANVADLLQFCNNLKPQLCFVQSVGYLKKTMKPDSEIRFILVERTAIIHPPDLESQPQYLFPLWKRPCFTVGKVCFTVSCAHFHLLTISKNGVRFEMKKKSVDVFFESEEVRDNCFNVIGIAAQKTPTDSVPLRQKLEMIVRLHATPFDPTNAAHVGFAQRLWDATIARYSPGAVMPPSTESELWKELGVSTTSLALDLKVKCPPYTQWCFSFSQKVCNLLGLVCLLYFAENYPSDLDEMLKANAKPGPEAYPVFPTLARISYMFFSLLNLGKKQTSWYPTFVTFPMWNFDSEAFEVLVCIGLRLFNKKWVSSLGKNKQQCMNDLVADLTDTLGRPPAPDGVPYVFSMFNVLLARKAPGAKRNYFLPTEDEGLASLTGGGSGGVAQARHSSADASAGAVPPPPPVDAWCFSQKFFLSSFMAADEDRRAIMTSTHLPANPVPDPKEVLAKRAEKKRLELKWEAVRDVRNEFKSKFVCLVCDKRKRAAVVLPCSHFVMCRECFTEGMVCPQCKAYAVGFVEVVFDDTSLVTLR